MVLIVPSRNTGQGV